jgi:hypothetical protein
MARGSFASYKPSKRNIYRGLALTKISLRFITMPSKDILMKRRVVSLKQRVIVWYQKKGYFFLLNH